MESLEQYWRAVQYRVCANCIDSDGHANCRLSGEEECGLKAYFPKIVETVLATQDQRIEPYIVSLRNNVCAACRHQTSDGTCSFRTKLDCGLDRYFPLIVEAIEEVRFGSETHRDAFGD